MSGALGLLRDDRHSRTTRGLPRGAQRHGPFRRRKSAPYAGCFGAPWVVVHGKNHLGGRGAHLPPRLDARPTSAQRSLEVLRHSLEQTIDFLAARGIQVLLMGEVPLYDRDPIKCVTAAIKEGLGAQGCRISAKAVQERIGATNRMLAELAAAHDNVSFFSPLATMCDEVWCSPVVDHVYLYRDRMHLNRIGAEYLARSMRLPHPAPRS